MLDLIDIFSALICCKNSIDVCLKRPKINEKEAGGGPFKKKKIHYTEGRVHDHWWPYNSGVASTAIQQPEHNIYASFI